MKQIYLAVTGTMGSGKSTVARLLAKKLNFQLLEENFGENAFLPRFYKDMPRWAFHSQTFFLMEKITQMLTAKEELKRVSVIQDVPIQQDVFSYAKAQYVLGHMDDAQWRLYLKIYRSFASNFPNPDVIIYLKTSLAVVEKRISARARRFEKQVPEGYLEVLEMLNESWMKKETNGAKTIIIDTDPLNLVRTKMDIDRFVSIVRKELSYG